MTRWAKTAICCGNMSEADTHLTINLGTLRDGSKHELTLKTMLLGFPDGLSLHGLYKCLFKGKMGRPDATIPSAVRSGDQYSHQPGELLHRCIWMGRYAGPSFCYMTAT